MLFLNRIDAGRRLAEFLSHLEGRDDVVVVGLPRGGVPVAAQVAEALQAPLDVIVVRKLGVPFQPELAMGAIGEGGVRFVNRHVVASARVDEQELAGIESRERVELARRAERFRRGRPRVDLAGQTVVVVDDGIATGASARIACEVARAQGARRVVLAVPVAPPDWEARLENVADELVSVATPAQFAGVGQWYNDFDQTTDDEVVACLEQAPSRPATPAGNPGHQGHVTAAPTPAGGPGGNPTSQDDPPGQDDPTPERDEEVSVPAGSVTLAGHLTVPALAPGGTRGARPPLVLFVHGSGSSRHSPRNRHVAAQLNRAGLGTLLFDLLTPGEEVDRAKVFDIELLAQRLAEATRWLRNEPQGHDIPIGYFGASTGAAAALWAAAEPGTDVAAVVSRGGRPDLAPRLAAVTTPTLLIVGGHDPVVLDLNREAQKALGGESHLEVVHEATHLFEEPGALDRVAQLASTWFTDRLAPDTS